MNYSSVISHHTDRSASTKRQWVGSKSADYHPPVGAALLEAPAQQSGHWGPPKQWPRGSLLLNCWCHWLNSQRDSLRQNNLVLFILVRAVLPLWSEQKPNYDYVWSVISKSTSPTLSSSNTSYFLYYSLPPFSVVRPRHRRDRRREQTNLEKSNGKSGLYESLRDWQGPATLCLLPLTDHLEGTSHLPPWGSPQVQPTSASTSCWSMAIPRFLYPWQLGICRDGSVCDPSTALQAATPRIFNVSFNVTAVTEPGLSLSWIHIFKQLGCSSASPISSSRASAHAGTSAPVAIRAPNCQAGMAVTELSLCLYTPLSLCQIQQSLWDANAFTPTCFV